MSNVKHIGCGSQRDELKGSRIGFFAVESISIYAGSEHLYS
jgi:hypothetical protein